MWRLGFERTPVAYSALEDALHDPDVEVRREAVWALARMGEVKTLPLIDRALLDPDREVRQMAGEVLTTLCSKHGLRR